MISVYFLKLLWIFIELNEKNQEWIIDLLAIALVVFSPALHVSMGRVRH